MYSKIKTMKEMKDKKIIMVGCGHIGKSASTIMTIKAAKECGMAVEHVPNDQIEAEHRYDALIIDEMPECLMPARELEEECTKIMYNPARDFNLVKPITRAERRAKRPRNRRRKF